MIAIVVILVVLVIGASVAIIFVLRKRRLSKEPLKIVDVAEPPADNVTNLKGTQESIISEAGANKPGQRLVEQKLDEIEDVSGIFVNE